MQTRALFVALVLPLVACQQGYKSADDLRADQRGPDACDQSCRELGMRMTAFVLVEHGTSGCVCGVVTAQPTSSSAAAAAAAGHVVLEEARRAQQQTAQ